MKNTSTQKKFSQVKTALMAALMMSSMGIAGVAQADVIDERGPSRAEIEAQARAQAQAQAAAQARQLAATQKAAADAKAAATKAAKAKADAERAAAAKERAAVAAEKAAERKAAEAERKAERAAAAKAKAAGAKKPAAKKTTATKAATKTAAAKVASVNTDAVEPLDDRSRPNPNAVANWAVDLRDMTLANTFHRWAAKAGYRVRWDAEKHIMVEAPTQINGTFEEAVARILASPGIAQSAYPLEVCFYPNDPPLARITRRGDSGQCQ